MTGYWLVKSEPDAFSWDQQVANRVEPWTGVRNHMAKNNLKAMQKGDLAFFYHSNIGKQIVGIVEVAREAYPDPTAESGGLGVGRYEGGAAAAEAGHSGRYQGRSGSLADMPLVRMSRLVGDAGLEAALGQIVPDGRMEQPDARNMTCACEHYAGSPTSREDGAQKVFQACRWRVHRPDRASGRVTQVYVYENACPHIGTPLDWTFQTGSCRPTGAT